MSFSRSIQYHTCNSHKHVSTRKLRAVLAYSVVCRLVHVINAGRLLYDAETNKFVGCQKTSDGKLSFLGLYESPKFISCEAARKGGSKFLQLANQRGIETYCEQDINGGGWELITRITDTNGIPADCEIDVCHAMSKSLFAFLLASPFTDAL